MATQLPSASEWVAAIPSLKRRGREYIGGCPLCGGDDRFHVKDTERGALVGCRGCLDGRPGALALAS